VLEVLLREGRPLSELAAEVIDPVPQVLLNITLPSKKPLADLPKLSAHIRATERKLDGDGRVLVRWSGTEAKLRLMVEGPDADQIAAMVASMTEAARIDSRVS
jgi:phosphoglucosamine mutase